METWLLVLIGISTVKMLNIFNYNSCASNEVLNSSIFLFLNRYKDIDLRRTVNSRASSLPWATDRVNCSWTPHEHFTNCVTVRRQLVSSRTDARTLQKVKDRQTCPFTPLGLEESRKWRLAEERALPGQQKQAQILKLELSTELLVLNLFFASLIFIDKKHFLNRSGLYKHPVCGIPVHYRPISILNQ
jgi:hypothetical protein